MADSLRPTTSAKSKRPVHPDDSAQHEPMSAAARSRSEIRRNPSTDQKKVRRSQVRKTAARETTVGELQPGDVIDGAVDNNGDPLTVEDVQRLGPISIIDYTDSTASAPVPTNGRVIVAAKVAKQANGPRPIQSTCRMCGDVRVGAESVSICPKCGSSDVDIDLDRSKQAARTNQVANFTRADGLGLEAGDSVHVLGNPTTATFVGYDTVTDRVTLRYEGGQTVEVSPDVVIPDDTLSAQSRLTPSRTASIHDHILGHLRGRI